MRNDRGSYRLAVVHHSLPNSHQYEQNDSARKVGRNSLLQRSIGSTLQHYRELNTDQHDGPTEIDPHQKNWNRGKRAVVSLVAGNSVLEVNVTPLSDGPQHRRKERTTKRRPPFHFGVGKEYEQHEISGPYQHK